MSDFTMYFSIIITIHKLRLKLASYQTKSFVFNTEAIKDWKCFIKSIYYEEQKPSVYFFILTVWNVHPLLALIPASRKCCHIGRVTMLHLSMEQQRFRYSANNFLSINFQIHNSGLWCSEIELPIGYYAVIHTKKLEEVKE